MAKGIRETSRIPFKNKAKCELPGKDSNLDKEIQNLLCYRYTTG